MLSILLDYSIVTNSFSLIKLFLTNKESYQLFQNNFKIPLCLHFIESLGKVTSKNVMYPYNFWSDNIDIVFNCLCACEQGKHIIYSIEDGSTLSYHRVRELNNILIGKYPNYKEKTMHKTKRTVNPNYWSDEDGDNGEEVFNTIKSHYIVLVIRPKRTKKYLEIKM